MDECMVSVCPSSIGLGHLRVGVLVRRCPAPLERRLAMGRPKTVLAQAAATVVVLLPILSEGVKYKFKNYAGDGRKWRRLLVGFFLSEIGIAKFHFSMHYGLQDERRYVIKNASYERAIIHI